MHRRAKRVPNRCELAVEFFEFFFESFGLDLPRLHSIGGFGNRNGSDVLVRGGDAVAEHGARGHTDEDLNLISMHLLAV